MGYGSKYNKKMYLVFQQVNRSFYRSILTIWEILKVYADNNKYFAFICSQMNVSFNFALEKCVTCYLSKNYYALFYTIFLTR